MLTPAPRARVEDVNGVAMAEDDLDPEISYGGHVCLGLSFFLTVLAYTVFALYAFFTRPETETFLQLPTSDFDPVSLLIGAGCTNAPFCGDITVGVNYTGATGCESLGSSQFTIPKASAGSAAPVERSLCFTDQQLYSVETTAYLNVLGVQVDFAAINPGTDKSTTPWTANASMLASGFVRVTSPSVDADFRRLVNMDTWQVKTLVLGQNVKRRDGVVVSRSLFPLSIQYEGKRPNWRATLFITMSPLTNVFDTERPGTLLDTIASIGGAAGMVTGALIIITPIVAVLLPGEAAESTSNSAAVEALGEDNECAVKGSEPISQEATPAHDNDPTDPLA